MSVHVRSAGAALAALVTAGVLLSTAACSGSSFGAAAASSGEAGGSSAASSPTSPPTTSTAPTTSRSAVTAVTAVATSSSSSGELDSGVEGRSLTLADFFNPSSDWQEKRYNIADQKDVPGIATRVDCYGKDELELRLGNNFQELKFSAAQANDSLASDQNLSVEVLANNAQVEIRSVPFNQIQAFTIPVAGVNALKIRLSIDTSNHGGCSNSVIAVVTGAVLS